MVEKLSAKASDGQTKIKVLSAIAEEHNVKWNPDAFGGHDSNPPKDLLVRLISIKWYLCRIFVLE